MAVGWSLGREHRSAALCIASGEATEVTPTLWCPHWPPRIALLSPAWEITSPEQQPLLCLPQIHCHRNCSLWDAPTHSAASVNRARGEGEVRQQRLYPARAQLQRPFKGLSAFLLKHSVCLFAQEDCCKNEKKPYTYIPAKFIDFDTVPHAM